jgi:hypothetical protein
VSRHLAPPAFVIHEIESELVHVDVHVVPPASDRQFWFLFTTGMSALPMTVPRDLDCSRHAELSILLPPDWKLDRASWIEDTRWFWPIAELKSAALLPHRFRTWLGEGHTIGGVDPAASFDPSTRLSNSIVVYSPSLPAEMHALYVGDLEIELLTLMPVYPEELDHKLRFGLDALLEKFELAGVDDVIDPGRPSALSADEAAMSQ